MKSNRISVCILAVFVLGATGCGSVKKIPSFSQLAPLPGHTQTGNQPGTQQLLPNRQWDTSAVCLVGKVKSYRWKWNMQYSPVSQRLWVKNNTPATLVNLISKELQYHKYTIKDPHKKYLTRQERLSIKKQVLFKFFYIKEIKVKEGICYDMNLVVVVSDYLQKNKTVECSVWARHLRADNKTELYANIFDYCVKQLFRSPKFRKALECNQ